MNRLLAALCLVLPALAAAQSVSSTISGARAVVNAGPGDQSDPHVSGDWVAYTSEVAGASEIRVHHLPSRTDHAIPNGGAHDFLSDIAGTTVVFTRMGEYSSAIYGYDVNTGGTPWEVAPQPGSNRRQAAAGGGTVAWMDLGFADSGSAPEIMVAPVSGGAAVRLTQDTATDRNPAVAPTGDVVVWARCSGGMTGCDILQSRRSGTTWTNSLVASAGEEALPDTNGQLVVYSSLRTVNGVADRDIFWRSVSGGAEQRLALPGQDDNANISGNLIAFERRDPASATPNTDIAVYDVSTHTLYRLTQTPESESLNDISVAPDGLVRVVWSVPGAQGLDVLAFSFRFVEPPPPDGGTEEPEDGGCLPPDEEVCSSKDLEACTECSAKCQQEEGEAREACLSECQQVLGVDPACCLAQECTPCSGEECPACEEKDTCHCDGEVCKDEEGRECTPCQQKCKPCEEDGATCVCKGDICKDAEGRECTPCTQTCREGEDKEVDATCGPSEAHLLAACASPGSRPLLGVVDLVRTTEEPDEARLDFAAIPGEGLACIESGPVGDEATAAWVTLSGREVASPDDFHKGVSLLARRVRLEEDNALFVQLAGSPGSTLKVRMYGAAPECAPPVVREELAGLRVAPGEVQPVEGEGQRFEESEPNVFRPVQRVSAPVSGCSAAGSGMAALGLVAVGLWLGRRRSLEALR